MAYMIQQQERTARARADDVGVSSKQCIEICSFLRGKDLDAALGILEGVRAKTRAIPFRRFTNGVGHRKGMAAGRYPVKAAGEFTILLENVKANAATNGLSGRLKILHLASNRASRPIRNRAKYRGEFKRTHLEIVVGEAGETKKASKPEPKVEKPEVKSQSTEKPKEGESTGTAPSPKPEESKEIVKIPEKQVPVKATPPATTSEKTVPSKQKPAVDPEVKEMLNKLDKASIEKSKEKRKEAKNGD